jgi:4-alpha-glucanotransferase
VKRSSGPTREQIEKLARCYGIAPSYVGADGETYLVSTDTLRALLRIFGVHADNSSNATDLVHHHSQPPLIEPVVTIWSSSKRATVTLSPKVATGRLHCRLQLEDGRTRMLKPVTRTDGTFLTIDRLPIGYHRLQVESGSESAEALLLAAPRKAYNQRAASRRWGVFVPPYALRSDSNWGAGDLRDLEQLSGWLNEIGGTFVGTLPMTAEFLSKPFDPSPYSPASRLFWNEFYLHIPSIPEFHSSVKARAFAQSQKFITQIEEFRKERLIDYREQMAFKREVLELMSEHFFSNASGRRDEFEGFSRARPELQSYARFRAVTDRRQTSWQNWPERLRQGKLVPGDFQREAERYHLYVQWCAQQQIDSLSNACRKREVTCYLDLPLGVSAGSFDCWRYQHLFATGATVGAPPDLFFTKGQHWGLAPLLPHAIRADHYAYPINFLRLQMRLASLLRLDHVMGLHRLYWIPDGFPASEGAFVHYRAEEFYAILSLESHRHKTALVGENLGTVPPEVNTSMQEHQLNEMYVVQYEVQPDARRALRPPPSNCVAGLNTHDMPPFAAFWNGADILDRMKLGLLSKRDLSRDQTKRRRLKADLIEFLKRQRCLRLQARYSTDDVFRGCCRFLAKSDAQFILLNLEDLWGETEWQNTPGTTTERKNWVRKIKYTIDEMRASQPIRLVLGEIARLRNKRGAQRRQPRLRRHGSAGRGKRRRNAATNASSARFEMNSTGEWPLLHAT